MFIFGYFLYITVNVLSWFLTIVFGGDSNLDTRCQEKVRILPVVQQLHWITVLKNGRVGSGEGEWEIAPLSGVKGTVSHNCPVVWG